jgi:hypothetical protein
MNSTATRNGLDGPGIESRWWYEIFRTLQTGHGAHLISYTTVTVSFQGVKRPVRGFDHPLFSAEVRERVGL